jgi:hypothetical protein
MTSLLYRWPLTAKFDRVVPKAKFYQHGHVAAAVRARFVDEVQRITWAYKLAESTLNLVGTTTIPEIQVFAIDAKDEDVSDVVLTAIDRAVKTPIIFEVTRGEGPTRQIRMVAAPKQPTAAAAKLGAYLTTSWQDADNQRSPLPTAIDLPTLFTALLEPLLPMAARPGEELLDVTTRLEALRQLEREIGAIERRIRNEPQLNRKVELHRALKTKQASLAALTSHTSSPTTVTKN